MTTTPALQLLAPSNRSSSSESFARSIPTRANRRRRSTKGKARPASEPEAREFQLKFDPAVALIDRGDRLMLDIG
jgi:hypothetical protein